MNEGSIVASTSRGEIEYALRGSGPVILMLHGTPGGYDQGLLDVDMWKNEGFSILTVSRAGYLRTPLSIGKAFDEQAEAIEALLDELGISKVAVLAISGGGPMALHFAQRYPDRLWALILMTAVSQQYTMREGQMSSLLSRLFMSGSMADLGVWLYDVLTRYWTSRSLKEMLKQSSTLDSKQLDNAVTKVMSIPEQVAWYKRFVRAAFPMSLRIAGFNNDLEQLNQVSFTNLEEIRCPTLVLHGTADRNVSYTNAEFSASSIPNAKLYSLENVGHIIWLGEHVSRMNWEVLEFLRECM